MLYTESQERDIKREINYTIYDYLWKNTSSPERIGSNPETRMKMEEQSARWTEKCFARKKCAWKYKNREELVLDFIRKNPEMKTGFDLE